MGSRRSVVNVYLGKLWTPVYLYRRNLALCTVMQYDWHEKICELTLECWEVRKYSPLDRKNGPTKVPFKCKTIFCLHIGIKSSLQIYAQIYHRIAQFWEYLCRLFLDISKKNSRQNKSIRKKANFPKKNSSKWFENSMFRQLESIFSSSKSS